jgi:hypothetical protein
MTFISKLELIEHDHFKIAFERAERVVQRGLQGESLIFPLFGPTRVGKSEVIKTLLRLHPESVIAGVRQMPMIRVGSTGRPTRRSLPEKLLEALGSRRYGHASSEELTSRACELLSIVNTRVIVFEEMQHIVEQGSQASAREAADWLKVLAEEMNVSLILTGTPVAREMLASNEQLRDRAEAIHVFKPYNWNRDSEQFQFRRALLSLTEALTEAGWNLPDAQELEFSKRVYGSCFGRIGMMTKLFTAAESIAPDRSITYQTFMQAHEESIGTGFLPFNPFDQDCQLDESLLVAGFVRVLDEARMPMPRAKRRPGASS